MEDGEEKPKTGAERKTRPMSSKTPKELTGLEEDLVQAPDEDVEIRKMRFQAKSMVQRTLDEAKARAYGMDRKPRLPKS